MAEDHRLTIALVLVIELRPVLSGNYCHGRSSLFIIHGPTEVKNRLLAWRQAFLFKHWDLFAILFVLVSVLVLFRSPTLPRPSRKQPATNEPKTLPIKAFQPRQKPIRTSVHRYFLEPLDNLLRGRPICLRFRYQSVGCKIFFSPFAGLSSVSGFHHNKA